MDECASHVTLFSTQALLLELAGERSFAMLAALAIITPTQTILNYVWTFKTKFVGSDFKNRLILTLIQRLDNVQIWIQTWQCCINVENRLFDVATKYQRRYNVESTSFAGGAHSEIEWPRNIKIFLKTGDGYVTAASLILVLSLITGTHAVKISF